MRGARPFPGLASDGWEASFSITGGPEFVAIDVDVFPFWRGERSTPLSHYLWCSFDLEHARWKIGRTHPDEYGEWEHVERAGDVYGSSPLAFSVEPESKRVEVDLGGRSLGSRLLPEDATTWATFSLVSAMRDELAIPIETRAPLVPVTSLASVRIGSAVSGRCALDLCDLEIPGGWTAGSYSVVVRAQHLHESEGTTSSFLSPELRFAIR